MEKSAYFEFTKEACLALAQKKIYTCAQKVAEATAYATQKSRLMEGTFSRYELDRKKFFIWQKQWWVLRFNDPRSPSLVLTEAERELVLHVDRLADLKEVVKLYPLSDRADVRKTYYQCLNPQMRRLDNSIGELKEAMSFKDMLQSSDCTQVYLEEAKLRWLKS